MTKEAYSSENISTDEIQQAIVNALEIADIDHDGSVNALTDGLLLIRYLFGLDGDDLISYAISNIAQRDTRDEIVSHIEMYMP